MAIVETDSATHYVDVLSTKDGPITLVWPKNLSTFDAELLCDFLDLAARAMAHQVELSEQRKREERFTGFDSI